MYAKIVFCHFNPALGTYMKYILYERCVIGTSVPMPCESGVGMGRVLDWIYQKSQYLLSSEQSSTCVTGRVGYIPSKPWPSSMLYRSSYPLVTIDQFRIVLQS